VIAADGRSRRRWLLQQTAGVAVGAACLVWLFHDLSVRELTAGVRTLDWPLLALGVAVDVAGYSVQGLRWKLLLRAVGPARWLDITKAIYVGLFASEILPMRPGEVVRAYLMARTLGTRVGAVVPSMLVERLFDGVWLTIGFGVMAMLVPLPQNLVHAGDVLGAVVLVLAGAFFYVVLRTKRRAEGFRRIGLGRATWLAFALSLVFLASQVMAFWLVMRACGLALSLWIAAAVVIIIHLGTAVPNAPANVGTYQFFTVLGLSLFGVDKATATAFSMIVFVTLTVPLWLLGYAALVRTRLSLRALRAAVEASEPSRDAPAAGPPARRRGVAVALLVGLSGFAGATLVERAIVRGVASREGELLWISDVVLSGALAMVTYLWLNLRSARMTLWRLERDRLVVSTELALAASMQRRLLTPPPASSGLLRWAAEQRTAGQIGGDFYYFRRLDDGSIVFIVGDISGKGIPAALLLASTRTTFRMLLHETQDPGVLVTRFSHLMYADNGGMPYVTCVAGIIDAAAGTLRYVNAGHPAGLIVRGGARVKLSAGGPPAGLFAGVTYDAQEVRLGRGDLGVFVTDGVTEAIAADEEAAVGVLADLAAEAGADPARLCETVLQRARSSQVDHNGVGPDDCTAVSFFVTR
jgi:uncharacterized membrane protein YbhN (UPF0104 family)